MKQDNKVTNEFREFEYQGWQQSVDQYHASFGSLTSQTIETLLDVVQAEAGTELLDIATGPGYVAAQALKRQCQVTGVDFSEAMVTKAQQLHPHIKFVQGIAEDLPFEAAQFDAAVMNFGILHLADPDKAISEAFRVIRPQGKLAFSVWDLPEKAIGLQIVHEAIQAQGNLAIALPEGPPFFHFSNPEHCIESLAKAGFNNPVVQQIPLTWELETVDELFDAFYQGTARTGGFLRAQSEQSLADIRAAVQETALKYISNNKLVLPMPALVASAHK
ncbi:MAG: class I SAM-dependent methyltransferase [Symploca sp. SIO2E6]|nr:class I SAM-dependent methyltransferase [Symploca sp. SIO2E6]